MEELISTVRYFCFYSKVDVFFSFSNVFLFFFCQRSPMPIAVVVTLGRLLNGKVGYSCLVKLTLSRVSSILTV